jgi:hypothetical protein
MFATVAIHTARNSRLGGVVWAKEDGEKSSRKRKNGKKQVSFCSFMEYRLPLQDTVSSSKTEFSRI